jgi:glycosyltransferase involved in cell wall biosynthesis
LAARKAGYNVTLVTNVNTHAEEIRKLGIKIVPLNLNRGSMNLLKELSVVVRLVSIYRQEKPDIVHHVAIKPILYGTIAARLAGLSNVVNALTGMGYLFTSEHLKARIIRPFLKYAFKAVLIGKKSRLIMQNQDDCTMLVNEGIVNSAQTRLIRGAGVDTSEFFCSPEPLSRRPVVVFPARMLKDKGVVEFVAAAEILKKRGVHARFVLVGDTDSHNHAAISVEQLAAWAAEGYIEWWDRRNDMPEVLAKAHIVCLPSYREGLPKALLEAASSGRPIVTTDTIGCREVVRHDENGFLVPLRSTVELADALQCLIENPDLRQKMGLRGRELAVQEFSVEKVIAETLAVYKELIDS